MIATLCVSPVATVPVTPEPEPTSLPTGLPSPEMMATPIPTPTSQSGRPDPVLSPGSHEGAEYFPNTNFAIKYVEKELTNNGAGGNVLVIAAWYEGDLRNTIVFFMGSGEKVKVRYTFSSSKTTSTLFLQWYARPASAEDASQGNQLSVIRG